ncbi:MAG: sulfurtransferase TusA family protein [Gammaproteobacteria bacterium]|jgi:tRNA 2-thiouridine synthesizing protein A
MARRESIRATTRWDAGDAGCSRLIVGVRRELERLAPGHVLEVTARDSGAKLDLFVWCRMTGHSLESEAHPIYVIRPRQADDERTPG